MMQGSTAEADPYAAALRLEAPAERARAPARLLLPDGGPGALDGARLRLDAPWPLCIVVTEVRARSRACALPPHAPSAISQHEPCSARRRRHQAATARHLTGGAGAP